MNPHFSDAQQQFYFQQLQQQQMLHWVYEQARLQHAAQATVGEGGFRYCTTLSHVSCLSGASTTAAASTNANAQTDMTTAIELDCCCGDKLICCGDRLEEPDSCGHQPDCSWPPTRLLLSQVFRRPWVFSRWCSAPIVVVVVMSTHDGCFCALLSLTSRMLVSRDTL